MDVTPYVTALADDVARSAGALGPEAAEVAVRLSPLIDNAVRLMLLEALSHATGEITNALDGQSVEARLRGREIEFVVVGHRLVTTPLRVEPTSVIEVDAAEPGSDADEQTARVTVRLPESLKLRAEELAADRGQSLNTWIVGAMRLATMPGVADAAGFFAPGAPGRNRSSSKRVQGWVR